jgi:protein-disulfide isomerase
MITKETHHTARRDEKACETKCCKGGRQAGGIISIVTALAALVAMVFAILAYNASKSGPTPLANDAAQRNLDFVIAQNGGEENFDKLMEYFNSEDYVANATSSIDQMLGQPSGDSGLPEPVGSLDAGTIETLLSDAYYFGNKDAKIVILEYSDLLCPYCKRHYTDQTIEQVVAAHPDEVALIFKNYPIASLHPSAPLGARGLYCAGKVGGDELYYNFLAQAIAADDFTDASVLELAKRVGVQESDFTSCYNSTEAQSAVNADIDEGSSIFGINGTPGNVVLNRETGEYIVIGGAYPVSEFENAVSQLSV